MPIFHVLVPLPRMKLSFFLPSPHAKNLQQQAPAHQLAAAANEIIVMELKGGGVGSRSIFDALSIGEGPASYCKLRNFIIKLDGACLMF